MNGYTRISYEERVKIELLLSQGKKRSEIALTLNRPRSTINREIERNSGSIYRSELAQLNATQGNKIKHKGSKIQKDPLLEYKIILHLKQHWSPEQNIKTIKTSL